MPRLRITLSVTASLLFAFALPGCFSSRSASSIRSSPAQAAPEDVWPARDRSLIERLCTATPQVIPAYELALGASSNDLSPDARAALERPEAVVKYNRLHGKGLLRRFERPSDVLDPDAARLIADLRSSFDGGFNFNASFVTSSTITGARWERHLAEQRALLASRREHHSTGPASILPVGLSDELAMDEGIAVAIPPVAPSPYRGLILHLTTLAPNEYERRTLEALSADGWAVVSLETSVRITMPVDPVAAAELPRLETRYKELSSKGNAFRQVSTPEAAAEAHAASTEAAKTYVRMHDIRRGWFTLCTPEQIETVAPLIAAAVDDSLAENAYAAEGVLDYLASERPDLPQHPLVLVGMSAGALATPAVAARLGPRVSAAVIIGGAADMLTVSRTSDLKRTGVQVRCTEDQPAPDHLLPALTRAYLASSRLDPYTTAPLLAQTPVLLMLADNDTVVPAACGRLLCERLQNPDCYNLVGTIGVNAGHMELFYLLPRQGAYIARWLRNHTSAE